VRFEFKSGIVLFCFSFIFVSFGESCLLVSWCAGGRCGMMCSDKDRDRSRRPGAEDRRWSHRPGTRWPSSREVGWHRVQSASCLWRRGARVSWLSLKTTIDGMASKLVATVSPGLASKPVVGFLIKPQNQGGGGFPDLGLKIVSFGLVIWASKSP
jgi:hypothetical protein